MRRSPIQSCQFTKAGICGKHSHPRTAAQLPEAGTQRAFSYVFNSCLRPYSKGQAMFLIRIRFIAAAASGLFSFSAFPGSAPALRALFGGRPLRSGRQAKPPHLSPILDLAQTRLHGLAGDCCSSNKIDQAFEMPRAAESNLGRPDPGHRCAMQR